MPDLPFATQAYGKRYKGLPALQLENLYVEQSPGEAMDEVHLLQVPGKALLASLSGAGRGLFRINGAPISDLIAVTGATIRKVSSAWSSTNIGYIPSGTAPVKIISSPTNMLLCDGARAYVSTGGSFAQITDPDLGTVLDVEYSSGYYLFLVGPRLFFSAFETPTDISSLDFVSAGKSPDTGVGLAEIGDVILLFGAESIEPMPPSGNADAPFYSRPQGKISVGCVSRASMVKMAGGVMFVGQKEVGQPSVYFTTGSGFQGRSTAPIDDLLRKVAEADRPLIKGSTYADGEAHVFYQLDIPGQGTFVLDLVTNRWHQRRRYGEVLDRAMDYEAFGGEIVALGREGGLYKLTPDACVDESDPLRWLFTAQHPVRAGRESIWNFIVRGTPGETLDPAADPMVSMRYSDDGGAGWSSLRNASMGQIGERKKRVLWRQLGETSFPGRVFEVSGDAAARWTPTACQVNEAF